MRNFEDVHDQKLISGLESLSDLASECSMPANTKSLDEVQWDIQIVTSTAIERIKELKEELARAKIARDRIVDHIKQHRCGTPIELEV